MKTFSGSEKGFTVLEMILALIITAIVTAIAGLGLIQAVQGMVFTKVNAATMQKGQIAMTRLVKEFNNISSVTSATTTSINFTSYKAGVSGAHYVVLSGNAVVLDGDILTDQVNGFSLNYYDSYNGAAQTTWQASRSVIEVTLFLAGAGNAISSFRERVAPRNLQ